MKYAISFLLATILSTAAAAQVDTLHTDRPGKTDAPDVLNKKELQLETGAVYAKEEDEHQVVNSTMLRYGVTDKLELRTVFHAGPESFDKFKHSQIEFFGVNLGLKYSLMEEKGIRPAVAAIGSVKLPLKNGREPHGSYNNTAFVLAFENHFSQNTYVDYNVGIGWDAKDEKTFYQAALAFDQMLSRRWEIFEEYVGDFHVGSHTSHMVNFGIEYFANDHFQLNAAAGQSIGDKTRSVYATVGLAYLWR